MKNLSILTIFLFATSYLAFAQEAPVIRGQVRTVDPSSKQSVALPKISVELFNKGGKENNNSPKCTSYTDENGFYYFTHISAGSYFIQINKRKKFDITIQAANKNEQFIDLPVISY